MIMFRKMYFSRRSGTAVCSGGPFRSDLTVSQRRICRFGGERTQAVSAQDGRSHIRGVVAPHQLNLKFWAAGLLIRVIIKED